MAMTALPAATLRLFDGYAEATLREPRYRAFLLERLLEEGDRADLRWLAAQVSEVELVEFLEQAAGRRLSARSRAFWRLVLGHGGGAAAAGPADDPLGREIWPLA